MKLNKLKLRVRKMFLVLTTLMLIFSYSTAWAAQSNNDNPSNHSNNSVENCDGDTGKPGDNSPKNHETDLVAAAGIIIPADTDVNTPQGVTAQPVPDPLNLSISTPEAAQELPFTGGNEMAFVCSGLTLAGLGSILRRNTT